MRVYEIIGRMNFTFSFRPATTTTPKNTVRHGSHENLPDARRWAQAYAKRVLPDTETVKIESDDGMIRERWVWLDGQWEREDLI